MIRITVIALSLLVLPGLGLEAATEVSDGDVAKLHVVDCLLPGQVRRLGQRTYLTPRRPTKTTAVDCEIRGGEYVAFDRADYKTALKVWMTAAEQGDPDAQANVAEIFEKGLGTEPNYEAAHIWYAKAAEQGHTRAQFNLGTLYEMGLGVPADKVLALNWYRRAWGMEEDELVFATAAARETESLRQELEASIAQQDAQLLLLTQQVETLQDKLRSSAEAAQDKERAQAQALQALVAQVEQQKAQAQAELSKIALTREPVQQSVPARIAESGDVAPRQYKDLQLGRYYALLIGNENYSNLDNLQTPLSDIARARRILEEQYGFTVITIEDGSNVQVMEAINDLYPLLKEEDNLLLFYAGHGNRLETQGSEIGYWLPANADTPPRNTYWVPNEFISGHLARLKAKRVLVVADSCYAGLLSSEPTFLLLGDQLPSYDNQDFLKYKLDKKSRLLMSSGGDQPVLDGGGGNHSVFARALLDVLEDNQSMLAAPQLFLKVKSRVETAMGSLDFEQIPEFKTIKAAGHEVGDFFFVPTQLR